jgi:hypothetical protein
MTMVDVVKKEEAVAVAKDVKVDKEQIKIDKINKLHEREGKVFAALKDFNYKSLVSDAYSEMDSYVQMVIRNISTGCIIEGMGGVGKTYRVINECLKAGVDMVYTDSFTTPSAFYVWLFKNRNKDVIICDDVAGFLTNEKILSFLKGGLGEVNGHRIINYMTTKPLKDEYDEPVDNSFEMTARMIIITNYVDKNKPHIRAVLTRVNYCDVILPRDELLNVLGQIVKNEYDDLSLSERNMALTFLIDNTSGSSKDLNIRTLFKIYDRIILNREVPTSTNWKTLTLKMLKRDDRLVIVEDLLKDESLESEEARVDKFFDLTGDSRATYFRLKKTLEKRNHKKV